MLSADDVIKMTFKKGALDVSDDQRSEILRAVETILPLLTNKEQMEDARAEIQAAQALREKMREEEHRRQAYNRLPRLMTHHYHSAVVLERHQISIESPRGTRAFPILAEDIYRLCVDMRRPNGQQEWAMQGLLLKYEGGSDIVPQYPRVRIELLGGEVKSWPIFHVSYSELRGAAQAAALLEDLD